MTRPLQASRELVRIADVVDSSGHPSRTAFRRAAGRLVSRIAQTPQEGELAVPLGELLAQLGEWLTAKYRIDAAYRSYADRVRGPWRDSLVDHWYTHAEEERKQAYDLAMKIVALGGDPMQTIIDVPPCLPNLDGFCASLMKLELDAIENAHAVIQMAGENGPVRVLAEQVMYVDAQHLDDLRRMFLDYGMAG